MRFCWSTLRVRNLEESIKFYQDIIGLNVVRKFSTIPGVDIAFLGDQETQIELICDGENRNTVVGADISWGFKVESIDEVLVLIKEKGINIESGPFQPNPHIRYFFIKDPNGMTIQLVENIA
jgi:lactoylglutathione lyase